MTSTWACRGSLEIGDMLSDIAAAPMEMTLLGIQGKVLVCPSPFALSHCPAPQLCKNSLCLLSLP